MLILQNLGNISTVAFMCIEFTLDVVCTWDWMLAVLVPYEFRDLYHKHRTAGKKAVLFGRCAFEIFTIFPTHTFITFDFE